MLLSIIKNQRPKCYSPKPRSKLSVVTLYNESRKKRPTFPKEKQGVVVSSLSLDLFKKAGTANEAPHHIVGCPVLKIVRGLNEHTIPPVLDTPTPIILYPHFFYTFHFSFVLKFFILFVA